MTTQITTSTAATATAYSNQRKVDRCSNGVLYAHLHETGTHSQIFYSTDNGATWTLADGVLPGTGTATYIANSSFFIDQDDYMHVVWKQADTGYIYYKRGTPNAERTAWTWSASFLLYNGSTNANVPDIVVHRQGTGWTAHIVYGRDDSYVMYRRVDISSSGTLSLLKLDGTAIATNTGEIIGGTYSTTINPFPSIDFNHTGDGKTVAGGTPHLYVAWSAGATGAGKGIRFKKATYSGGSWTWGTEVEIDSTRYVSGVAYWLNCLFDGTRVVIPGMLSNGSTTDIVLHERDANDTTTTTRVLVAAPANGQTVQYGSAAYDASGNVYLVGHDGAAAWVDVDLRWWKWTRTTNTYAEGGLIDTTIDGPPYVSVKRGYSNNRIEFIYTDGTASPYSVTYDSIYLNTLPAAPTSVTASPVAGKNSSITVNWTHNDPDADTQAKYQIRYRKKI